jgi:dihydroorotase
LFLESLMPRYDVVFREARILAEGGAPRQVDVAIRDGRIEAILPAIPGEGAAEVRCAGRWLLPGAVDMHVHLRDPGMTHKEDLATGTAAAVASGVTTVCDMPNTRPPVLGIDEFRAKAARAREVAHCDVRLYVALGRDNVDAIARCAAEPSFAGVKVFLGATTGDMLSDDRTLAAAVDALPCLFVFHAEDEGVLRRSLGTAGPMPDARAHHVLRPAAAAIEGARRIAALAAPGRRLHICHLSAADELPFLTGPDAPTAEVAPHHLWFTADDTARQGNLLKVNPPVRLGSDRDALRIALADGRIAAVATDHAPHTLSEKAEPYTTAPSGVPGLDTLVPSTLRLVQLGLMSMARAVDALSAAPARLLGLTDRGTVAEGLRADLYLWDEGRTWIVQRSDLRTRCGWSPFEGFTLAARPDAVWFGGRQVVAPDSIG